MKMNRTSLSLRSRFLVGRKLRSGTRLSRRKQWASAFFEPFRVGAFSLLGRPPHSEGKFSASVRVLTTRSQSSLRGQGGLWDEEGGGSSERARKRTADRPFGIANGKSQMANLKSEICDLKFLAQRELGPSAAVRRLAPEERAVGGIL